MASSVHYSGQARRDLDEIADYLLERNPLAALRFAEVVRDTVEILSAHPYLGSETDGERRARSWLIAGFPYRLHYVLRGDEIEILHIRHTSRQPWPE